MAKMTIVEIRSMSRQVRQMHYQRLYIHVEFDGEPYLLKHTHITGLGMNQKDVTIETRAQAQKTTDWPFDKKGEKATTATQSKNA